jgi:putative PEP-CTERM system histidine kinase
MWTAEPDLPRPDWLSPVPEAWLIIPLRTEAGLVGWVVLLRSEIVKTLTWEDRDLLKASGRAAAAHLALIQATEALSEAQQFDAFNRLSAFVVHDIKNVVAQLSLIVSNAHVHDGNPDFVKDAVATIEHAVGRMNRLLTQLHKVPVSPGAKARIELDHAVSAAVERCRGGRPAPELRLEAQGLGIIIDAERLQSVVENLVKNAQEATPDDDRVTVSVARRGERALLVIDDTGCGMDAAFVRERLFKPFDTTKGNSGMGIGAHEARELVRGAGGDLKVSSSPGQGTRIELWFPLAHPANPRSAEAPLRQSGG